MPLYVEHNKWKIWQNTILQMIEIPEYIEHFIKFKKKYSCNGTEDNRFVCLLEYMKYVTT